LLKVVSSKAIILELTKPANGLKVEVVLIQFLISGKSKSLNKLIEALKDGSLPLLITFKDMFKGLSSPTTSVWSLSFLLFIKISEH
jgi:hypothetical protein